MKLFNKFITIFIVFYFAFNSYGLSLAITINDSFDESINSSCSITSSSVGVVSSSRLTAVYDSTDESINSSQPIASSSVGADTSSDLPNESAPEDVSVYAQGAILMESNSGKILYNKSAYEKMYPASTTKIITALLVLDMCNLSDTVNVSYYAVHSVPATYTIANILPGETFTVKDLLYILMIGSANDAAFVLAEYIANGGNNYLTDSSQEAKTKFNESIQKFSDIMNNKAKEIGCTSTNFVNPNGVHNENHYSTAYDLALIAKYAYKNVNLMNIVNTMEYSLPNTDLYTGETRSFKSTNALLYNGRRTYYEYANGMKTGYTDPAGYCIVATASRGDVDLIVVLLNSEFSSYSATSEQYDFTREADCVRLFNYGFDNYSYINFISSGNVARTVNIINGEKNTKSLDLIVKDDIKELIVKGEVVDITPDIHLTKFFAPIAKGDVVGKITYKYNGQTYTSDLVAAHDVYPEDNINLLIGLIGTFVVLLLFVILLNNKKSSKNN